MNKDHSKTEILYKMQNNNLYNKILLLYINKTFKINIIYRIKFVINLK